jgi:hypothetical protein
MALPGVCSGARRIAENPKSETRNLKQIQMTKNQMLPTARQANSLKRVILFYPSAAGFWSFPNLDFENCFGFRVSDFGFEPL